jgi:hypothetical protein
MSVNPPQIIPTYNTGYWCILLLDMCIQSRVYIVDNKK